MRLFDFKSIEAKINKKTTSINGIKGMIKKAGFKSEKATYFAWLSQNHYFNKYQHVLEGVYNSNKWSLLKNEIASDLIVKKKPFWYIYCYHLLNLNTPKDSLKKFDFTVEELCLFSGFFEQSLINYPLQPVLILKLSKFEVEYKLDLDSLNLPYDFRLKKDIWEEYKTSLNENINSDHYLALENQITTNLIEKLKEANHFQRFIIVSSLSLYKFNLKYLEDLKIDGWYKIINESNNEVLSDDFDSYPPAFSKFNLYKLIRKSDREILNEINSETIKGIICFKILQTRLHYNLELDLNYDEISRYKPLENYIKGVCNEGILEAKVMSEVFKWPELNEYDGSSLQLEDIYSEYNFDSPLTWLGYHVGENGIDKNQREQILSNFYTGISEVEKNLKDNWKENWGDPKSPERLRQIVYHIHNQIINKRSLGYTEAVYEWIEDLNYLRNKYYSHDRNMKIKFKFPEY